MTRVYYVQAKGGFVVYDVTNPATKESAIKWKIDIDQKVDLNFPTSFSAFSPSFLISFLVKEIIMNFFYSYSFLVYVGEWETNSSVSFDK